jgi:hypothetical protein
MRVRVYVDTLHTTWLKLKDKLGQNSQYQAPGHTIERVHDKVIVGFVQFNGGK